MSGTRKRWLVIGAVAAWGAVLLVLAIWAVGNGPETVREQSDLATGREALDRAVETLQTAAGPGVAADVGPYDVQTGCRITLARRGTEVERVVTLTVPAGGEGDLLERLEQQLPAGWDARYYPATGRLRADAGDFVAVVGRPAEEAGQVQVTVATGCRPGTDPALPGQ